MRTMASFEQRETSRPVFRCAGFPSPYGCPCSGLRKPAEFQGSVASLSVTRQARQVLMRSPCRRGPSARSDGGRAARSLISGLESTAFALTVYASSSRSPGPTQDALLAVGQLYQVGLATHRVPAKGLRGASSFPSL